MSAIDRFLNSVTMYRLLVYGLGALVVYSLILSAVGVLPYGVLPYVYLLAILVSVSWVSNKLFASLLKVPTNVESWFITAHILYFVISPVLSIGDALGVAFVALVAVASKYIFNIKGRHIFNPVAIAAVVIGIVGGGAAVPLWWVGSVFMFPAVAVVGLLVVRKVRKFAMFAAFIVASVAVMLVLETSSVSQAFLSWPLVFFGSIMLTEPLTMPARSRHQIIFAIGVGAIAAVPFSFFGVIHGTPELALVIGNIFAWIVNPKRRLTLSLVSERELALDTYEFSFATKDGFVPNFLPGQYSEWTFAHEKYDARGVRRYFTIASSPTEGGVKLGIKFNQDGSSFKNNLLALGEGDTVFSGGHIGDFVLPSDAGERLVFIAGGIGVTPFRSMIQYLVDKNERRDVVLIYTVKDDSEFAYRDVFDRAVEELGIKVVYINTEKEGFLNKETIRQHVSDLEERTWYLSGPNVMVDSYRSLLKDIGISRRKIKTDYFPGF